MAHARPVRYGLLRHQGAMLKTGARILRQAVRRSVLRTAARTGADAAAKPDPIQRVIAPPAPQLVDEYIAWCGARGRYEYELPPHMVSQWSLPLVGDLLLQLPYRLTSVINQGVSMRMHGPLPRAAELSVQASIESAEQLPGRIKVVALIVTGTLQQPTLVETRLHMSFLLPGKPGPKNPVTRAPDPEWQTAGLWHADERDGLRFALLTGDFNPIHWCGPLARRSVFGGKVLHGFGSLVRSYELLQPGSIREIDVRFLRPVPLPCSVLSVQLATQPDADGWRAVRLAGSGDTTHLAGRLR